MSKLTRFSKALAYACGDHGELMGSSQYKEYIMGLLFLKHLSELFDREKEQLAQKMKRGRYLQMDVADMINDPDKYTFFVPPEAYWENLKVQTTSLGTVLNNALKSLQGTHGDAVTFLVKGIDFKRIGQRAIDDRIIASFIQCI